MKIFFKLYTALLFIGTAVLIPVEKGYSQVNTLATFAESDVVKQTYQYTYDNRGRVIEKLLPGVDPVYMIYDNRDRLVLSQDGNQRSRNEWIFHKYDQLNRDILMGIIVLAGSREEVNQVLINFYSGSNPMFEIAGNSIFGYTNKSFPVIADPGRVLLVNYYDNYAFLPDWGNDKYQFRADSALHIADYFTRVKGLLTGKIAKVIGGDLYLRQVNYYDDRHRLIQTVENDHVNGLNRKLYEYRNFFEKPFTVKCIYEGKQPLTIIERFEYDDDFRLLNTFHKINDEPEIMLSNQRFNELGQVIEQNLHQQGTQFLQGTDMRYNERGWITNINGGNTTDDNSILKDLFNEELYYNSAAAGLKNKPLYNGNISAIKWGAPVDSACSIRNDFQQPGIFAGRLHKEEHSRLPENSNPVNNHKKQPALLEHKNKLTDLVYQDLYHNVENSDPIFKTAVYLEGGDAAASNTTSVSRDNPFEQAAENNLYHYTGQMGFDKKEAFVQDISAAATATVEKCGDKMLGYTFLYDRANRLTTANFKDLSQPANDGAYDVGGVNGISYDANGNILAMETRGTENGNKILVDQLTYSYNGNQLLQVEDSGSNTIGFRNGSSTPDEYAYDANGNLKKDANKNIAKIDYNFLNLPQEVRFIDGNRIIFLYAANGKKLSQQIVNPAGIRQKKLDYINNVVYRNDTLNQVSNAYGRVLFHPLQIEPFEYQYYLKDHLGNIRIVFTAKPLIQNTEIVEENHYYPFGELISDLSHDKAGLDVRHLYNGKEKIENGLEWYDYEARMYDVQLGRWNKADPLAEKFYSLSPYVYGLNDPLRYIDPDGQNPADADYFKRFKEIADKISLTVQKAGNTAKETIESSLGKPEKEGSNRESAGKEEGGWWERLGTTVGAADVLAGSAELIAETEKIKSFIKTTKYSKIGKGISAFGKVTAVASVGLDLFGAATYVVKGKDDPNAVHPAKAALNIAVTGAAIFIPGAQIPALVYTVLDLVLPEGSVREAIQIEDDIQKQSEKIVPGFKLLPRPAY